jgi:acetamidase/formamidase
VNRQAMTCRLPFGPQDGGLDLPLAPFFGVMGVAPPPEWGMVNTKEPRAIGGNLDNKELTEGTTLFLPIFNKGALFSAGDGHGVQGDGEVCINALEICLTGHFKLSVVKGGGAKDPVLKFPRAETKTHFITMGMNEDLDLAMKQALREMIAFICSRTNLSDADAYQFCSLAVDFRVTQTVNGEKGVHGMLKRGYYSDGCACSDPNFWLATDHGRARIRSHSAFLHPRPPGRHCRMAWPRQGWARAFGHSRSGRTAL